MKRYVELTVRYLKRWSVENYLLLFGGLCCLLILLQMGGCSINRIRTALLMRSLDEINRPTLRNNDAASQEKYSAILKSGLLGKPAPEGAPGPMKALGILGDAVLIGKSADDAKPYTVGAEVPEAGKLVEIATDRVVLEKDGKKNTLLVFPAGGPDARSEEKKPAKEPEKKAGPPPGSEPPKPGGPSEAPAHE